MRTTLRAAVFGLAIALGGSFTAQTEAMPMPQPQVKAETDSQIVKVRGERRVWRHHRQARGFKAHNRPAHAWRSHHGRYHNWRGHRGYRAWRPGYRHYGGYWYPPAAFSVGIVVGPRLHGGNRHVRWCRNQYMSYRASDNTFQPYHGPRARCVSPYSR
jgi:hypothetical protein